jgi:hypothetical protein
MSCFVVNDFSFRSHDLTIMLISLGIIDMGQESYVASGERDLLEVLKVIMQQPPLRPFQKYDI